MEDAANGRRFFPLVNRPSLGPKMIAPARAAAPPAA